MSYINVILTPHTTISAKLNSNMSRTLDNLQPGDETKVVELRGDAETAQRLMEMGILPGTPIKVVRFAPMGDPVEISVRGYHLSLRRTEAAEIAVE